MSRDLHAEVLRTLRDSFSPRGGEIVETTPVREFLRDSIDAVELIAVLSSTYRLRVDPADFDGVETVRDLIEYVGRTSGQAGEGLEGF